MAPIDPIISHSKREPSGSAADSVAVAPEPAAEALGSRAQGEPLLRAQNLHRILGSGETATHILKGVSVTVHAREYVSIVGASGSGKSTLLYLLGGLDRPTEEDENGVRFDPPSRVFIEGEDTTTLNDAQLAYLRNEKVGFVFQFHYLLKEFTAQENVALPIMKLGKISRDDAMDRAVELLKQLGLGDKIRRRANRLSGGEQQRVALARALANQPAVLFADEPTGNLDKRNAEIVADIFSDLANHGQALVMVTHDSSLASRAKRIIKMEDGRIVSDANQ
ncbi:MAG TPA: ABC transporter ATP-binding protein [Tepidisphaeraceae bacterium]|nr:ABC transporter ATP-binding protein [Tepidisphaeraceae bacterium]